MSEAYAAKLPKSKQQPKNCKNRRKSVQKTEQKNVEKNKTGETPQNTKNDPKTVLPGTPGPSRDARNVDFGGPGEGSKFRPKNGASKNRFFRVLGDFRPPLGNQKPGTGRVGSPARVSRLEVLSTLRGEIDVFAWEALRFSRFRASLKSRPPATASKMLCLSDESRAKKVGLVICHAGASGEARRIFSPKGSCRPPWEFKLNLIRVRSD